MTYTPHTFNDRIYDTEKTDKLYHIANIYFTVNGSSQNLACGGGEKGLLTNLPKVHGNRVTSTMFSQHCRKTYPIDLLKHIFSLFF